MFAAAWILGSDLLLEWLIQDRSTLTLASLYKGWAFVGVTSLLLYGLLRRHTAPRIRAPALPMAAQLSLFRGLGWPMLGWSLLIGLVTAAAILLNYRLERGREVARLEAVSTLRGQQIADWVRDRRSEAAFLRGSEFFGILYLRWQDAGDDSARDRLAERLSEYSKANRYAGWQLVDASGRAVLGDAAPNGPVAPPLRDAVQRAITSGDVHQTGLYAPDPTTPTVRLDFASPLLHTGKPPRVALVMKVDPESFLLPTLRAWPVPSSTAESLLVRREGDKLLGTFGRGPALPLTTPELLAAKAIRGDVPMGTAFDGEDFRGIPVIGVVRPIDDTGWFLVVKMNRSELHVVAARTSAWILAAALLAVFGAGLAMVWLRERQALRVALARSSEREAKLRALYLLDAISESSTDAIYAKDREGRYVLRNRTARQEFAPMSDTHERETITDDMLFGPGDVARLRANDALVMAENRILSFEEDLDTRQGRRSFLVTKGPLRDAYGQVVGVFGISRDITERKRTAQELEQHRHRLEELVRERTQDLERTSAQLAEARDRAEAATRAKSAFLANMSHEIRTPMNVILGIAQLLQRDALPPAQQQRVQRVNDAAHHLSSLINDVLDLSKIESGKFNLEHAAFSLRSVLERAESMLGERARQKGLGFSIEAGDVPDRLRGDATRLSQALLNLMSNAIKFTEQGLVDVRVEAVHRDAESVTLRFTVSDTGPGIAPAAVERLFQAFEQVDNSSSRRHDGTGLGLAITRHLALLMGGDTGVQSTPGAGSRFWFTARLALDGEPSAAQPDDASHDLDAAQQRLRRDHGGARILLAEDNLPSQEVAAEWLRAAALEVVAVGSGDAAVQAVREQRFDLVLMDIQMPGLDGMQATRQIRQWSGAAQLPVLALSANAFGEDRMASLEAGMNDHLVKPIDPRLLYAALLRWLPPRTRSVGGESGPGASAPAAHTAPIGPIDGVDPAAITRYFSDRHDVYRRALQQFVASYERGVPAFATDADLAELRRAAHSLKGAASAIGATAVADAAAAMADPKSTEHRPDDAQLQAMRDALARLIGAIRAGLEAAASDRRA